MGIPVKGSPDQALRSEKTTIPKERGQHLPEAASIKGGLGESCGFAWWPSYLLSKVICPLAAAASPH